MISDSIGLPQIVALIILLQRGAEEVYSARNTRALIAAGAKEVGRSYYPVVATTHLAWIASIFFLIPSSATESYILAAAYILLQGVRYWVIGTLGRFWTHRIFTIEGAPVTLRGPYKYFRHPNYAVTITETFLLPAVFGAWAVSIIMGAVWTAVLAYKIELEDEALSARRALSEQSLEPQRTEI
ncbi:isoprenylcysteine carboxyl methyltransferase family protein [Hyphomicrobium sp. 99]|uniref:isoprenylcysteine carboxyl methyltransferase family protein n=1 Tax=Hyphomicrobium sp. 99 TaxID=1163419 RepID=UPI0005F7F8ED|nr:isoprenylcysteine carboxylmethyltransferase family protein [Hyphomicrobium sp. 99]